MTGTPQIMIHYDTKGGLAMGKKTTLFMLLTAMLLCCFPLEAKAGQASIDVSRLPNYNFTERTGQTSGDGWSWGWR